MVVMAGGRLRGRGFDSRFGTFFFHSFFPFFSVSFSPLSFSFMLAPPFQCSSIFLVVQLQVIIALSKWPWKIKNGCGLLVDCMTTCQCQN